MLKFSRRNITPPGQFYFFEVPETKQYFQHPEFAKLELLVRNHYYSNNLSMPDMLPAVIEDYMCRHLPESFCSGRSDGELRRAKILTFWVVSDNTFRMLPHDDVFAEQAEAERRAAVCLNCPNNLMGICSSCSGLKLRFAAQMRGLTTSQDRFLGVCAVDGSLLTVKVFAPMEIAERVMNKERTYEYEGINHNTECWIPKKAG